MFIKKLLGILCCGFEQADGFDEKTVFFFLFQPPPPKKKKKKKKTTTKKKTKKTKTKTKTNNKTTIMVLRTAHNFYLLRAGGLKRSCYLFLNRI